jgi:hypothetical protein
MPDDFAQIAHRINAFIRGATAESFETIALDLYALQRRHNSAYAKLCGQRDVTKWEQIPTVPTIAFKEMEMTSLAPSERTCVFYSSGTTQQDRSRHFHSPASLELYKESLWQWFHQNFPTVGDDVRSLILFLTPRAQTSSLAHMFETISCHHANSQFLGIDHDGVWSIDDARLHQILNSATEPIGLLGTAFQFVHLIDSLKSPIQLPPNSWIMETGGYKGRSRELSKSELHRLLSEKLRVAPQKIFSEYGMSELSSQAYDRADGLFRFPRWARFRIMNPANGRDAAEGEPGLIRIYDLANVWSVMAIQTEDLGVRVGDAFKLVGRAAQAEARGCSLMNI